MIAGELNGLVAHFCDGFDGAIEVFRTFVAHRIELKSEGYVSPAVGFCCEKIRRRRGRKGDRGGADLEKLSSGDRLGFHNCRKNYQIGPGSGRVNFADYFA